MGDWLWGRKHYQFFPLVLLAAGGLAWFRKPQLTLKQPYQFSYQSAWWALAALACYVPAMLFSSNWLGYLGFVLMAWALVSLLTNATTAKELRAPVFLLLLALPLPLNFDLQLIIQLQKMASGAASKLLDLAGVYHNVSGVAIITPHRNFLVEEACSGIHSLFSGLCAMIFLSAALRYGLVRIIINSIQTIFWVIVANTARVFAVVYASTVFQVSLDSGWRHEALGIATYSTALLLALCTDRLFQFLVPYVGNPNITTETAYSNSDNALRQFLETIDEWVVAFRKAVSRPRLSSQSSRLLLAFIVCLVILPLAARNYVVAGRKLLAPQTTTSPQETDLFVGAMNELITQTELLPTDLNGWKLAGTEQLTRSEKNPLGTNSKVFRYTRQGLDVQFSIDGYYDAWHDLAYCYTALDWQLKDQRNFQIGKNNTHSTSLSMFRNDGQAMVTYFSCFDSRIHSIRPGNATIGRIKTFSNLWDRLGIDTQTNPSDTLHPPVFQIQLVCQTPDELLPHELDAVRQLFELLSETTMKSLREKSE